MLCPALPLSCMWHLGGNESAFSESKCMGSLNARLISAAATRLSATLGLMPVLSSVSVTDRGPFLSPASSMVL